MGSFLKSVTTSWMRFLSLHSELQSSPASVRFSNSPSVRTMDCPGEEVELSHDMPVRVSVDNSKNLEKSQNLFILQK